MSLKIYRSEKLAIGMVLCTAAGMGSVIGMSFPLVTLLLEHEGFGASLIGINSAIGSVGILVIGFFSARMLGRHGAFASIITAGILGVGSLLALPLIEHPIGWFILRFSLALGLGFLWLLSESWLNMLSNNQNRGRIIGLYSVSFSSGLALGPVLVSLTGSNGLFPFAIAATLMLFASLPMLLLADRETTVPLQPSPRMGLFRLAPFVFIIGFAAGLFEMTAYALLPIYTLGEGLTEATSLYALSAFSAGGIALQYPLARLADIAGRQTAVILSAVGILFCLIALPYAVGTASLLMPLLFVWGGTVFGLYTVGLIMLGDTYRSDDLVPANALFIIFYIAGALFGPALSGGAMDISPEHGFIRFLLVMAALLVLVLLLRMVRRGPVQNEP